MLCLWQRTKPFLLALNYNLFRVEIDICEHPLEENCLCNTHFDLLPKEFAFSSAYVRLSLVYHDLLPSLQSYCLINDSILNLVRLRQKHFQGASTEFNRNRPEETTKILWNLNSILTPGAILNRLLGPFWRPLPVGSGGGSPNIVVYLCRSN